MEGTRGRRHDDHWLAMGAGTTGKLRIEPKTPTVDEAEDEQDAAQTRVRKGPAQPTEEQIIMHTATHLPFRDWCLASRG